jgi:hypothetical protein
MTAHLPPVPNCNYSCNNVLEKSRYSGLDKRQVLGKLRTPMHWLSHATLITLLCHSVVLSQSLAWDIPPRGAITYIRKSERWEVSGPPSQMRTEWLIPDANHGGFDWRYHTCELGKQPADFATKAFDDSGWPIGTSEFGNELELQPRQRTAWKTGTLCLRGKLDLGKRKPQAIIFRIDHDDGFKVFCNGTQLLEDDSYGRNHLVVLMGIALQSFTSGENLIAVQCNNIGGAQFLDLSIGCITTLPPGVKTSEDIQKVLREDRERGARVYGDLFGNYRPPPMLLSGELDPARQRLRDNAGDLRELGWLAGMDLQRGRTGGPLSLFVFRLYHLGDLNLRGKALPVAADGWQTLEFTVNSAEEIELNGDTERFVKWHIQSNAIYQFDGKLQIQRRLEINDGRARVLEMRSELSGRILRGKNFKDVAAELQQVETWQLATTHQNQDTAFKALVIAALKKGTAHLRTQLADANSNFFGLTPDAKDSERSYNSGRLALGLLALIKGGVDKKDEVLQRCLTELRQRKLVDTYSLGNALMALEAYYAPENEWQNLRDGAIDRPSKRKVTAADLLLMTAWTAQLLKNVDTRVEMDPSDHSIGAASKSLLRFGYVRGEWFDHSVNQYGLLGLYSAHLCDVPVAAQIWESAANHLLSAQVEGQGKTDLDLVDYRTMARMQGDANYKRTVSRFSTKAAGWNYQYPKDNGGPSPVWGSMTCAGITGLAICQAALLDQGGPKLTRLQNAATAARNSGFAWLAQNFSVRCHPGHVERRQSWFYYYLYGFERAALLSGIALIQDRDWYFEGAMVLCGAQQESGGWPADLSGCQDIERNAMAILFLKQSTLPVLTGR